MKPIYYCLLLVLAVASCDNNNPSVETNAITNAQVGATVAEDSAADVLMADESLRLTVWLDEQFEQQKDFSPEFKTRLGDKSDYDKLSDYTAEEQDRQLDWQRSSVAQLQDEFDYELLSEDARLSYDMWVRSLEQSERSVPWRLHGYIFGRGGPQTNLPNFLINFHRVDNADDAEAYISRLKEIGRALLEMLDQAKQASAAGIRQPAFAYDFAIGEIDRVIEGAPFNNSDDSPNSPLWNDIQSKISALSEAGNLSSEAAQQLIGQAQMVLVTEVSAAYDEIKQWLEYDKQFASEQSQGVWALPNGEAYYNYRLSLMTTLDLTADEIHNLGLSEVARIHGEMETIKNTVEYAGSLQEFFVFMREDERFYYPNTDEGRQDYLDLNNKYLDAITLKLPEYFGRLPKAALEVKRVESFREQPGGAQHYSPGSPDGSRPGVFYSHLSDMSSLPIFQLEDVAYHEGSPGHHMQISIQQELTEVPRFRTQYFSTAYTEGWGLYAEFLAKEMGFYEDPYSDFGRLSGELWRAIRLVVDTGLHAKQWSQEQAVQYFLDNSPQSESAVVSEIERYMTGPGQATAYKIGMLKIQQVRENARQALGDNFDIREFHDIVLGAGALPLPLLEQRVQRWVLSKQQ